MQVKVFEATDMASGLRKIRRELGPDALILSTRTIKSGRLGVLGKECLEITAAIDNQWPEHKSNAPNSSGPQKNTGNTQTRAYENAQALAATFQRSSQTNTSDVDDNGFDEKNTPDTPGHPGAAPHDSSYEYAKRSSVADHNPELRQEFDELKNMVRNLAGELSRMGAKDEVQPQAPAMDAFSSLEKKLRATQSHNNDNRIEELLEAHGINAKTARIIASFAEESLSEEQRSDTATLYSFLQETIADILTTTTPELYTQAQQKRMALIGPTGVGKTTTLAKIAAGYLATRSSSIALITIDTYRIAAVEQLKVYGEIMHLPVEVVINQHQLAEALERHGDKELILIDTAGRSPLDTLSIEEIQSFFTPELHIENHLVLSATTRDSELLATLKKFSGFTIHSTIFTKIDECSHLGVLLNTQIQNSSPISFITNGQRVPEDIVETNKQQLAKLIVPAPATAAQAAAPTTSTDTARPADTAQPENTTGKVQE
jgi:flagellar biosynthesis protein FlhF